MLGPQARFKQYGQSGAVISDHLPHLASIADEICFLKAMHTNEFNHAPAQMLLHTGSPRLGRPGFGSWVTYGLGSENQDLPGYMVLASGGKTPDGGKSLWGSGFLPTIYQGVQCRSKGEPILFVSDPHGMDREIKHDLIETIEDVNKHDFQANNDPEVLTRMAQYEMAFKMQVSVPDAMDISGEPEAIHKLYGTEPGKESYANNCLLARRLVERGVRFVQLFHWGWDHHGTEENGSVTKGMQLKSQQTDRATAALLIDLKQRGLLEETLVVWSGEFGRTPMQEGGLRENLFKGRDHHLDAFTAWMAGAGVKKGMSYGETDELGYYGVKDQVHVHDLQATILHLLGLNHTQLTYTFQGRDYRLTDVSGKVVNAVLA